LVLWSEIAAPQNRLPQDSVQMDFRLPIACNDFGFRHKQLHPRQMRGGIIA
jgi:hypothetical protein